MNYINDNKDLCTQVCFRIFFNTKIIVMTDSKEFVSYSYNHTLHEYMSYKYHTDRYSTPTCHLIGVSELHRYMIIYYL